jgi:tetratricopeptide (TPR) repeat protein
VNLPQREYSGRRLLGIDMGGCALRIADAAAGVPRLKFTRPMPLVEARTVTAAGQPESESLKLLKRVVEFESEVLVSGEWLNSMDCLGKLVSDAVATLSTSGSMDDQRCVVAVPPCFSQRHRSVVNDAIQQALPCRVRLVDDTLAALVACRGCMPSQGRSMVFSWGHSALSVALYDNSNGKWRLVAAEGNPLSGGFDITSMIAKRVPAAVDSGVDSQTARMSFARSYATAEDAKLQILRTGAMTPSPQMASGVLPLGVGPVVGRAIGVDVARLLEEMVAKALGLVDAVLNTSGGIAPDSVLLTGGMTRIPRVRDALLSRLAVPVTEADEHDVALGTVLCAALLDEAGWESAVDERRVVRAKPTSTAKRRSRWAANFVPLMDEAQTYADAGRVPEAVDSLEKLFGELGSFSSTLYRQLAVTRHSQDDDDSAYSLLRVANQRAPGDEGLAREFLRFCYDRGARAYKTGHLDKAIALADELVVAAQMASRGSKSAVWGEFVGYGLWLKSLSLIKQGDPVIALGLMKRAIALLPPEAEYRRALQELEDALRPQARPTVRRSSATSKLGRNEYCPCGSGKKYKKCHGR